MVVARRDAVQRLWNDASAGLSYRREHGVAVDDPSAAIVDRVGALLSTNSDQHLSIDQSDLTAIHELARANERYHANWMVRFCRAHAIASWLGAMPLLVATLIAGDWDAEAIAIAIAVAVAAPLIAGYLIYFYLPFQLLASGTALLAGFVRNSTPRPQRIAGEFDGLVMAFALIAVMTVVPLLWPAWLIERQWRTCQRARGAWLAVIVLLSLQVIGLIVLGFWNRHR